MDQVVRGRGGHGRSSNGGATGHDRQDVTVGPTTARPRRHPRQPSGVGERPLLRRLRQAGVDPDGGLPVAARKPPWLRVPARMGDEYLRLGRTIHDLGLVTVCEEAGCPNIYECWADGHGDVHGQRLPLHPGLRLLPGRHPPSAAARPRRAGPGGRGGRRMGLAHAVVTCVARDDLADGGAGAIAATVEAIRAPRPAPRSRS